MALLTHHTSTCADAFSSALFKDNGKGIYGIPCRDSSSRTSILSEVESVFEKGRSANNSRADNTLRKIPTIPQIRQEDRERAQHKTLDLPSIQISGTCVSLANLNDASSLSSYDDDEVFVSAGTSLHADSEAHSVARAKACCPGSTATVEKQPYVFSKWMKTMVRKSAGESKHNRLPLPDQFRSKGSLAPSDVRSKASSDRFVSGVQAASITIASCLWSVHTEERRNSMAGLDDATLERMMDRKHVLEELITTEEYYIRDLKSLRDQYLPILRECVWVSAETRQTMNRNVSEMLDIHVRLLDDISRALPCINQMMMKAAEMDMNRCQVLADPAAAAEVAKVFDATAMAFFVYEEYSAKYEEVVQAPKRTHKNTKEYGKGIETLTGAANSWDNRGEYGKRAMELYDMLFKPIQRLCKYPLLFRDIAKYTPAIDCPNTNRLLEKVRQRLDDQVHQVNIANSDPTRTRDKVKKTWVLQDRLRFDNKSDNPARLLGHVSLCGTLHVTWQNKREQVPHEYMACILFRSYLVLASVARHDQYKVKFAIPLAFAHLEGVHHGKGLYCPNAPHTSKVVFEVDHRIYEVLLSACSEVEHNTWVSMLQEHIAAETQDYNEYCTTNAGFCITIPSDIRSVGDVVGRPGTLARHQSLHANASASGLECNGRYIIINNLLSSTDPYGAEPSIYRSHSAPSAGDIAGVPVINLKRSERNHIESKLEEVWTKELIPFNATRTVKESSNTIKRLSVMSLISTKKPSNSSNVSISAQSDSVVIDGNDRQSAKSSRRPSMKSFRSKTSNSKNTPPSPTKRSSSLRSKLSLTSSVKNSMTETIDSRSSSFSSRKRNIRPQSDTSRWKPSGGTSLLDVVCMSPVSLTGRSGEFDPTSPDKTTNLPTPPSSNGDTSDSFSFTKPKIIQDDRRTFSLQSQKKSAATHIHEIELIRRHTLILHPPTNRSWRTVKRKKVKRVSQELLRERKQSADIIRAALPAIEIKQA
ncbi:hypothetical protein EX30DRAFT_368910 [Ascodesmis nigricans]|uniref:DH domain-containing protein n=1 Tax=Ascodesmis nigricans TaxID=341454 RepID=A0A4S2N344_9PEZI|nr:hypothetical protein EX30DRAFT_368910 [Ascodesmis nigricans]